MRRAFLGVIPILLMTAAVVPVFAGSNDEYDRESRDAVIDINKINDILDKIAEKNNRIMGYTNEWYDTHDESIIEEIYTLADENEERIANLQDDLSDAAR